MIAIVRVNNNICITNSSVVRQTKGGEKSSASYSTCIYFSEDFLQRTDHIAEGGFVLWYIALCLLATWVAIYFLTFKGTSMLGKVRIKFSIKFFHIHIQKSIRTQLGHGYIIQKAHAIRSEPFLL